VTQNIDLLKEFDFCRLRILLVTKKEEDLMRDLLDLMRGVRVVFHLLSEDCKQEAIELFHTRGYFTATTKVRILVSKSKLL